MAFVPKTSGKHKQSIKSEDPPKKGPRGKGSVEYNSDPEFSSSFGKITLDAARRRRAQYPSDPDMIAVTAIDPNDVQQELVDIGANLAYYGLLHNRAKSNIRRTRARREGIRGELAGEYRASIDQKKGGKAPTAAQIANMVGCDPRFVRAEEALAQAEQDADDLATVVEAIKVKAFALGSLNANFRDEKKFINIGGGA